MSRAQNFVITCDEKTPAHLVNLASIASFGASRSASEGANSTCVSSEATSALRHDSENSPSGFSLRSVDTTAPACDDFSAVTSAA